MTNAVLILPALAVAAVVIRTFRECRQGETLGAAIKTAIFEAARFGGVFLLFGPPLGLALYLLLIIGELISEPFGIDAFPAFLMFFYIFGAIPSLVTGIVASAAHHSVQARWVALIAALAGVVTSAVWLHGMRMADTYIGTAQIFAPIASGALCFFYIRMRTAAIEKISSTAG